MTARATAALALLASFALTAAACAPATPSSSPQAGAGPQAQAQGGGQQARSGGSTARRPGSPGSAQGPGNLTRLTGTVQMVLAEGVWLTDGKNFGVTPATRVTRGAAKQLSDLRSGEAVNITAERLADGTLQAKEVNLIRAQQGDGQPRQGGPGQQAQGQAGQGQPAQGGANTQRPQGQGGAQGQNQAGGQRGGQAQNPSGSTNPAPGGQQGTGGRGQQQAERTLPDGSVVVMGALEAVDAAAVTVSAGGTQVRMAVTGATVVMQREPAALTDLVAGVNVTALLSDGDAVMVNLQ